MNDNKEHINVFDFDETLYRVPGFTCVEAVGRKPYEWFDDPKSLENPDIIFPILNTIEKTWGENSKYENYLITQRVLACKDKILNLLKKSNCVFRQIYFLGREESKVMKLLEILDANPQAKSLTIYEDSLWEIIQYAQILADEAQNLEINFVFVDKSKVIKLSMDSVVQLCEYKDVERIKLL